MNKMYLVVHNWSFESKGQLDISNYKLFTSYEKAKEYFNKIKEEIKNKDYYNLDYDYVEEEKDLYCESVDGEYLYYHDIVTIKELEIDK